MKDSLWFPCKAFFAGKFRYGGQTSLAGSSPRGHKEWDTTVIEQQQQQQHWAWVSPAQAHCFLLHSVLCTGILLYHVCCAVLSRSVVSDSLRPPGL